MDLSKLPKLSHTTTPANDSGGVGHSEVRSYVNRDVGGPEDEGPLAAALDIFLAIGMGLLFVFLGMNYGRHLLGSKEAYPEITGTGYVWAQTHPKAGQEISVEELSPENRTAHEQRILGRQLGIVSESSLFLLGVALIAAGILIIVAKVRALPGLVRRGAAILGFSLTAAAVAYTLWALVALMRGGQVPIYSLMGIIVGGLSLFMQGASLRSMSWSPRDRFAGMPQRGERISYIAPTATASPPGSPVRTAHHRFAHQALRKQVFENPARTIGALQGPAGRLFLAELWASVSEDVGLADHVNPPAGLSAEMTQVGPYSSVVVTMPPPRREGEAHLIGIVLRSYVRQDGAVIERQPLVLYYALEVGAEGAGASAPGVGGAEETSAVLCEWQGGDHVRFADRVKPEFSAFREAMRLKVQARQEAEDRVATTAG